MEVILFFLCYGGGCLVDVDGMIVNLGEGFFGWRFFCCFFFGESDEFADASGLFY